MKRKRDTIASARANQKGKRVKGEVNESESREELVHFVNLPSAILTHILLQLPIKSVATCRCVCRTWNALISDPHFTKLYLECAPPSVMIRAHDPDRVSRTVYLLELEKFRSKCNNRVKLESTFKLPLCDADLGFDKRDEAKNWVRQRPRRIRYKGEDGKFGVVNSCNGLLCLHGPGMRDPLVVCNPVTGEFITLPKANKAEKTLGRVYAGFGFQPETNEYKVVRIWPRYICYNKFEVAAVEIHTLGKSTWRNVGIDNEFSIKRLEFPTCVNGALHWISFDGWQRSILSFNFESERFLIFPSPPHVLEDDGVQDTGRISMAGLEGFLYICDASSWDSCIMWVMKKYGVGGSWTKVFSIDNLGGPSLPYGLWWPVKHFEKGAAILMQRSCNCFVYYEPEKYRFEVLRLTGTHSKLFEVIPHTPSLISLKGTVKGDNIEVLNVHSRSAKFKLQEENEVLFMIGDS